MFRRLLSAIRVPASSILRRGFSTGPPPRVPASSILRRGFSTGPPPRVVALHKNAVLLTCKQVGLYHTTESTILLNLRNLLCATQIGDRRVRIQMTHDVSFEVHFNSAEEVDPFLKHMVQASGE
jgi:hypothetical protein